jgi:predicted Zn-dependent protease
VSRGLIVVVACAALLSGAAGVAGVPPPAKPVSRLVVDAPAVKKAMQDEIARSMSELHMGDEPRPYYLAYTLSDLDQATVAATFGALTADHGYRGRVLRTELRVGNPSFDNTNFEGGARVETVPLEDDYPALRRELWLRTDEAYKAALETLARKRAAAAGQVDEEEQGGVGDFSKETPAHLEGPLVPGSDGGRLDSASLRETVVRLSALFREFPKLTSSKVNATWSVVRRRLATSEGTWVDDATRIVRIEVTAETQADDGMKLRSFVPFSALDPAGLPPLAEMEKAVRAMATELAAMRTAPTVETGAGAVLFEGLAAAQITKLLVGDQLAGTPPPKTASAGSDDGSEQGALSNRLGQKVASPLLSAADDPLLEGSKAAALGPIYGTYRVDDEGVLARRVSLIEHGVLKGLLMTRTPRKEIDHSNGHGRAARFAGTRARVGTLVLTGKAGLTRKALLDDLGKVAKSGGVTTYVVRLIDDGLLPGGEGDDLMSMFSFGGGSHGPPPVRALVAYRLVGGKEELVRGLTLENLMSRSLKDVTAVGKDPIVYNYLEGGPGFSGIPSTVIAPALLVSDVDIRRQPGKNRKPPLYSAPGFQAATPPAAAR